MSETKDLKIFTIISQMEQMLESAPKPKLGGGNRRLVDVGEMFDVLGDLKVTIPEDIRRANSVLLEADTLLEHAHQEALDVVDDAQKEANALHTQAMQELEDTRRIAEEEFEARVAQDNVMREVQRRCELLQKHAEHSANVVYDGAKQYADAILQHLQNYLMENYTRVEMNREELGVVAGSPPVKQQMPAPPIAPQNIPPIPPQGTPPIAQAIQQQTAQPVEPVMPHQPEQPKTQEQHAEETDEPFKEEAWEPRRRRGLFHRGDNDLLLDADASEEDAFDESEPSKRKGRRGRKMEELDLDLEE